MFNKLYFLIKFKEIRFDLKIINLKQSQAHKFNLEIVNSSKEFRVKIIVRINKFKMKKE
jgi:hypothetical protein